MNKCIIYYPFKINRDHPSASNIRPVNIIKGFEDAGYEVSIIEGNGKERKNIINRIKTEIRNGEKYDFVYMESSTEPTLLTESHHLPTHPFLDFGFLKFCKKHNIKIGVFYRDIHWRFDQYKKSVPFMKKMVAYTFYYYDLIKYRNVIDVLYLPSEEMEKYIPLNLKKPVIPLPSGCEQKLSDNRDLKKDSSIKLLYVGGLSKELYNIEMIVKAIYENEKFELDICCRPDDWEANKEYYQQYLNNRIRVIHKSGNELDKKALNADIFSLVIEPTAYWEFAMPMKLFSYISYRKPILGINNTACGKFIINNGIGYTTDYNFESIKSILNYLEKNYLIEYNGKLKNLEVAYNKNTWKARASAVINSLYQKQT
ncbi:MULTISPECIES: glycosyltransferase family 1 protein [unclassified Clostridium]|uniref:glycosyltransferase family 1 protein n=1 Tax=unclassified Clostridium TaxID=2614128 RepID=UPI00321798F6